MTNLPYKGGFYEGSTAAQYVGRVKTVLEAGIGERWTVWKDAKKGWYKKILDSIDYKCFKRVLESDEAADNKCRPMGAKSTAELNKHLVVGNTFDGIEVKFNFKI